MKRFKITSFILSTFFVALASSQSAVAKTYVYNCFWEFTPGGKPDLNPLSFGFTIVSNDTQNELDGETLVARERNLFSVELLENNELKVSLKYPGPSAAIWDLFKFGETFVFGNEVDTTISCLAKRN